MKNQHLYPLTTIRRFFEIVPKYFMPLDTPDLFRMQGEEDALQALKAIVKLVNWKDSTDDEIVAFIQREMEIYNKAWHASKLAQTVQIKDKKHKKEKKSEKKKKTSLLLETQRKGKEPVREVASIFTPLVWSSLCKYVVQNGCFFDYDDLKVHASWDIFIHQMSRIHRAFCSEALTKSISHAPPVLKLNDENVHTVLLGFLGQLCKINHVDTAREIHNYIHLATQLLAYHDINFVGNVVINVLLAGLELADNMVALEKKSKESDSLLFPMEEKDSALGLSDLNAEFRFFPKLTPCFISHPIFQKPFSVEDYAKFQQNDEDYQNGLKNAREFLWRELPQSGIPLSEVQFSPRDTEPKEARATKDESEAHSPKTKSSMLGGLFRRLNLSEKNLRKEPSSARAPESPPRLLARESKDSPQRRNSGGPRPMALTRTSSGRGAALLSPGRSGGIVPSISSVNVANVPEGAILVSTQQGAEPAPLLPQFQLYLVPVAGGASTPPPPSISRNVSSAAIRTTLPTDDSPGKERAKP